MEIKLYFLSKIVLTFCVRFFFKWSRKTFTYLSWNNLCHRFLLLNAFQSIRYMWCLTISKWIRNMNYQKGLSKHCSVKKETNLNHFFRHTKHKELLFWFRSLKEIVKNHTLVGFFGMPYLGIVRLLAPMVSGELLTK